MYCVASVFVPPTPDQPLKNHRGELSVPTDLSACLHHGHFCLSSTPHHPSSLEPSPYHPPSRTTRLCHTRATRLRLREFRPPHPTPIHRTSPLTFSSHPPLQHAMGNQLHAQSGRRITTQTPSPNFHTRPAKGQPY